MAAIGSTHAARLATAACFTAAFGLYALTAARSVQGGDMGEFGLIGMVGGVAHPPGYPLYTLLLRGAAMLPFGPPFWRVALTSVAAGAGTVALILRLSLRLTGHLAASVATALVFAVSPLLWHLSGVPEVFALHAFLASLVLLFGLRLADAEAADIPRAAFVFGLALGLGMANHQTTVLLAPIVLWAPAAALRNAPDSTVRAILSAVAGGLLGLCAYLLLPLFARLATPASHVWGHTETLSGLITHVLRREYGTFRLHQNGADQDFGLWRCTLLYLRRLPRELAYVFAVAAAAGSGAAFVRRPGFTSAVGASWLLAGVLFPLAFNLPYNPVNDEAVERFFLLPNVLLAPFVAFGLRAAASAVRPLIFAAVSAAALLLGAVSAFQQADWAADTGSERFMIAEVQATAPDAIILGAGDTHASGIEWVTHVLGIRPDVHYLDAFMLSTRWYYDARVRELPGFPLAYSPRAADAGELANTLLPWRPVYVTPDLQPAVERSAQVEPDGFLDRVVPTGRPPLSLAQREERLDRDTRVYGVQPLATDAWGNIAHGAAAQKWLHLAEDYEKAGQQEAYLRAGARGLECQTGQAE